jgi:hypothetical protein
MHEKKFVVPNLRQSLQIYMHTALGHSAQRDTDEIWPANPTCNKNTQALGALKLLPKTVSQVRVCVYSYFFL